MGESRSNPLGVRELKDLRAAWNKLSKEDRPTKPSALWTLLSDAHEYPFEDSFIHTEQTGYTIRAAITSVYEELRVSAVKLNSVFEHVRSSVTPLPLMYADLSSDERESMEALQRFLTIADKLPERKYAVTRKPRLRPDPYAHAIALAVGWYVVQVEKGKFRGTYDVKEIPTSREGKMLAATLEGLHIEPKSQLSTIHREAQRRLKSKVNPVDWWVIFREVRAALRQ